MNVVWMPSVRVVRLAAAGVVMLTLALTLGAALRVVALLAAVMYGLCALWALIDMGLTVRAWRRAPLELHRAPPRALALGVAHRVSLSLSNPATHTWCAEVFDAAEPWLHAEGWPQRVEVRAAQTIELNAYLTPSRRGEMRMGEAQLRVDSLGGAWQCQRILGQSLPVHVYPNFAAVARYAWLAGDKRLAQIGIKSYVQRGLGTDFKQLREYQAGDAIRHVDWKASLRQRKAIVREFQDERDQCVLFLLDCGRRMRAYEAEAKDGVSHFDHALNALMLLSYVALKEGDEVGAMTFGHASQATHFAPRKGVATLNALMAAMCRVEPSMAHADYVTAARDVMRVHRKRALIVMLTNFHDEDAVELQPALAMLRTRHLVLVASLRERTLRELAEQPLQSPRQAVETAGAHYFEQARRAAFLRGTGGDPLCVDVEPEHLAVALVNRYHSVKMSGRL